MNGGTDLEGDGHPAGGVTDHLPSAAQEPAQRTITVAQSVSERVREHQLTLVAAGVAFYGFIALIPALVAAASVYALFSDPQDIQTQVDDVAGALPQATREFITSQLEATATVNSAGLSVIAVVSIVVALWSASAGVAALLRALAIANDADRTRGFAARRGVALLVTVGLIVAVLVSVWMIASVPALLAQIPGLGSVVRVLLNALRWPIMGAFAVVAFAGLYRVSSGYRREKLITAGPVFATVLWLVASALFSVYTANFSSYSRTYGSLTVVIVVMLWLWLSAIATLLGAELDAVLARRRARSG